ncbi:MAG TPA: hypothetical protein VKT82_18035 [Ktedonobacterales bacterium]|nr:hypothetical protein [Ktedonobacterales bacterium]
MSRGIDFSKLQPEPEEPRGPVRHIAHIGQGMSVQEFLEHANYPFYGLLLPSPGESKLNQYIRTSWEEIHSMSGAACLLLTTLVPAQPSKDQREFLTNLVGDEAKANQAWKEYRYSPEQVAKDVYPLAQQSQIGYDKLPCLVLMSDLNSNQRIIQRLPDWDEENLRHFFEALFTSINNHMREPDPQQRYQALKRDLGFGFQLRQQAGDALRTIHETVVKVDWSEVIQATLTNKELMAGAMKLLLGVLGFGAA